MKKSGQNGHDNREKEEEIVRRAQCGDTAAFGQLYMLHREAIYRYCFRMTKDIAEAEDITQEVFIRVLRKIHLFRHDARFATWLTRIAINLFLERLRRNREKDHVSLDELIEGEDSTFQRHIAVTDRHLALAVDRLTFNRVFVQLAAPFRLVLYLSAVKGYSTKEISAMIGEPAITTRSRLFRAKRKMRSLL